MKTLMITTAVALALGLSTAATADTATINTLVKSPSAEMKSPMEFAFAEASDFYQGDYVASSKAHLSSLEQCDLYTGKGGAEAPSVRWVTDY